MTFRCKRCEEKNLRCFVDTATGRCAGCILVKAKYSLFVSEEEWEKVQQEKREKRLEVARLKAQLAQSELKLLEAEAQEQSFANRDLAILNLQDRAKEQAECEA
jgi:transcription initiation factor TFIIIB Brf1 subunit/transcription initiation factor TFIIB